MQVDLVKRVIKCKKDNKNYTFLFLRLDSGRLIPINVRLVKDEEGNIKNKADTSILNAIATKF